MEYKIELVGGRRCRIWTHGQGGPVIYWGVALGGEKQVENVASIMAERLSNMPWTLVAFEAENWNRDYSPWALPSEKGLEEFTGGAKEMLAWLTDICIPFVENSIPYDVSRRMIGGYSLAGLFSLFAFYESQLFSGVASCSGSLWYPGWMGYADSLKGPKGSSVYLSLGRKEEKTRNRKKAVVGELTRWQNERVIQDTNVHSSELFWHKGGHFSDVDQRIAQAFLWLIDHVK